MKVEKQIVNRFMNESDLGYSYLKLKNDLLLAFLLCKEVMNVINNYKEKVKLGKKDLIKLIEKKENFKISLSYLEFLLDIIKNYFEFDLSKLSGYFIPAIGL